MKLPFLDRADEQARLRRLLDAPPPGLAVIYGRRRCGKSTLIQSVCSPSDLYFLADQREPRLQFQALAREADRILPSFAAAGYATWDALLESLNARVLQRLNVFLDEFPYLVQGAPELPSLLQHYLDAPGAKKLNLFLCGSSQRMMQGLVLDRTAPLYGRAAEILKVRPLPLGWLSDALRLQDVQAIEAYAVWGGVPRYWELATSFDSTLAAVTALVLDRNGVLHNEPSRLLADDMRTAVQASSILSLVGNGCHRLSEIAGRLGKPASSLTRPLVNLVELGYLNREVPWGDSPKSTRKTLYRLGDPFLQFHFRFVQPYQSLLELGRTEAVCDALVQDFPPHVAGVWENLARASVPFLNPGGIQWGAAGRWWGAGLDGNPIEFDVVAESLDRDKLLIGEAKWSESPPDMAKLERNLRRRIETCPLARDRQVVVAWWLKHPPAANSGSSPVFTPDDVLRSLR